MKRILIVCLLGMGLLLPSTNLTAKHFFTKRIVDVTIEGYWFIASSDQHTGSITHVKVVNSNKQVVLEQDCSGYVCTVNGNGLPTGYYTVQVFTTLTTYSENVFLN